MSRSPTLGPAAELFCAKDGLELEYGDRLDSFELGYEVVGPADAPIVLVQGGISAGSHVASNASDSRPGWWEGFVGEACPIDTRHYRVLGIDYLGGSGASTGPREDASFPRVSSKDQARATLALLDQLGCGRLHACVGSSYGGMVALALAALRPERVRSLVVISATHESHPFAIAWRSLQRRVLGLGIDNDCARDALAIARGMGMLSYRSAQEFGERFARSQPERLEDGRLRFEVEGYLEARGQAFVENFDATSIRVLSEAIDLHRVDPSSVSTPTTLVGARSDLLVPPAQLEELHASLAGPSRLEFVDSLFGHDAFLKEREAIGGRLASWIEELPR